MRKLGNTLNEMRALCTSTVYKDALQSIETCYIGEQGLDDEPFINFLGGDVYEVEVTSDIYRINTTTPDQHSADGYTSLARHASQFDVCQLTKDGYWLEICNITNNSGGNTYFIPAEFRKIFPTIQESMRLTDADHAH